MAKKKTKTVKEQEQPNYQPVIKADDYDRFLFSDLHGRVEVLQDLEPMGLVADCFSSFYKTEPELLDGAAKPLFEALFQTEEFQNLRSHTRFKDVISGMAASQVAPELIEQYKQIEEQLKQEQKRQEQHKKDGGTEPLPMSEECADALAEARANMRGVLKQAADDTEKAESAMRSFGMDPNTLDRTNLDDRWDLANHVQNDPDFAQVVELLGRMRNLAMGALSLVPSHGVEEIVDVTLGNDLSSLVPTELLKLKATPELFFADYYDQNLMVYEKIGHEQSAKGPVVVIVDISPSMSGERAVWASAMTLALLDMAIKQKRAFHFMTFGTHVHSTKTVLPGQPVTMEDKIELASLECNGGGTDFYVPLKAALDFIKAQSNFKKADILMITDGEYTFKPAQFKEIAQNKGDARIQSMVIQPYEIPKQLKELSNAMYIFDDLGRMADLDQIFKRVAG